MSSFLDEAGKAWRVDDLADLPDDGRRYEIVDGNLVVTPPSPQLHQDRAAGIAEQLRDASPGGWRVRVEYLLPLGDDVRVPDVVVYRWPLRHPRADRRNPLGPADVGLVVEVVSPRTRKTDRFAKPGEYAEAGVPLFWRVETEPELVLHAFRLTGGGYDPVAEVSRSGIVPAPWGDVRIDLSLLDS